MARKRGKTSWAEEHGPAITVDSHTRLLQEGFRRMALAGAFERIVVAGNWTHFSIRGELPGGGSAVIVTARGEWRRFLNPAAALVLLRKMGVTRAEVEMQEWDLDLASLSMRMRPDVTARRLAAERRELEKYAPKRRWGWNEEPARDFGVSTPEQPGRQVERNRLMDRKLMEANPEPEEEVLSEEELEEANRKVQALALGYAMKKEEEEGKALAGK